MLRKLLLPDIGKVDLTLVEPLSLDVIGELERALEDLLCKLRRELRGDRPDPSELEFESWSLNLHFPKEIL
jgi:hypothetical protein